MKSPNLVDLRKTNSSDPFQKKVAEIQGRATAIVRKTFSLGQGDLDQINAVYRTRFLGHTFALRGRA